MSKEIEFNEVKSTEAASLLLSLKGGRADYWWIIKMLYLVDRKAFQEWERPITYDYYKSLPYGPVTMSIYNIIKKNAPSNFWKRHIVTLPKQSEVMLNGTPAKIKKLSRGEVDLIRKVFDEFGKYSGDELVEYTHTLPEWHDPKGSSIPLPLSDILTALHYEPQDIERIASEIQQEEVVDILLGE